MKKLLALALLALACSREQRPQPQLLPKRCDGLCGHVVDAKTKQPIREFIVYVFANRPFNYGLPPGYPIPPGPMVSETVIESKDGSFVLKAPPEPVFVGVSARGYKSATTPAPIDASTEVLIELTHAGRIAGHVADEHGRPIANARVGDATSDARGDFEIDGPPADWEQLDISDDRHLPTRVIVRKDDKRLDVTLRDAVEIAGIVQDDRGAPLPGAGVQVICGDFASEATLSQRDGSFVFRVPPARCTLVAGPALRNDDEHHEVVPAEPRTVLEVDTSGGNRMNVVLRVRRRAENENRVPAVVPHL